MKHPESTMSVCDSLLQAQDAVEGWEKMQSMYATLKEEVAIERGRCKIDLKSILDSAQIECNRAELALNMADALPVVDYRRKNGRLTASTMVLKSIQATFPLFLGVVDTKLKEALKMVKKQQRDLQQG